MKIHGFFGVWQVDRPALTVWSGHKVMDKWTQMVIDKDGHTFISIIGVIIPGKPWKPV